MEIGRVMENEAKMSQKEPETILKTNSKMVMIAD